MEIREQLTRFCEKVMNDPHVNPAHIPLYLAIFMEYLVQKNPEKLTIDRDTLMLRAKISGRVTYNKCMRDLHNYGYIRYTPPFSTFLGSMVRLNHF
ncbi:MAG: hypothetical protein ABIY90_18885 [Puia sp.]